MSSNLTPQEAEILRLWGVIRKLKAHNMTDKEENIVGAIVGEYTRLKNSKAPMTYEGRALPMDPALRKQSLIAQAAWAIRELHDCLGGL